MEENNIIDVEVEESEEVIEEEYVEKEPEFSDEQVDEMYKELLSVLRKNNMAYSEEAFAIAKKIAINSKDYLDNNTYLWVMYTYALKYGYEGNTNAQRFIFIRMKSVIDAMEEKRPFQKALTFNECELDNDIITLIKNETEFMNEQLKALRNQFYKTDITLSLMFVCLLLFVFKYSLLSSIGMSVLVFIMNYHFTFKSLVKKYVNEQTEASKDFCKDEEIITFDLPVFNS